MRKRRLSHFTARSLQAGVLWTAAIFFPLQLYASGYIISGATITLTNAEGLFSDSDLTISSGSLVANGSTITVSGSLDSSGGSFSLINSTVIFDGSNTGQTINPGKSTFYRIQITGSGDWSTVSNPVTVSSTVVISAGSLTVAAGSSMTVLGNMDVPSGGTLNINANMSVNSGSLTNEGVINASDPAAVLTLPAAGILGGSGSTTLPSLSLPNASQTTTLSGPIHVTGALTNGAGHTLDVNSTGNYAMTVSSSWINSGNFIAHTSSVSFDGSSTGLAINPGSSAFYTLALTGPGSWATSSNPLIISSSVIVQAGTLTVASGSSMTVTENVDVQAAGTLSLQNNLLINGGSLTNSGLISSLNTSTLTLTGGGILGGSGTSTLPHVILNGSGQTTSLGGDIAALGQLTISPGHTLDANAGGNYQITVSSNWTNSGTFVPRTGTVEFNSTATLTGQTTFYNFSALTPGFTLTFPAASTQTVTGALTFAGTSANLIKLRSSISGTHWYLKSTGSNSIYAVDVKDSVASANTLAASASLDSTNNVNWTFGTTRTWVGPGNWSVAANWNPSGVPGSNDSVIFSNANNCAIDISTTVATMTMQSGYSGTISANQPLTINGGFSQAGGTFSLGTSTLAVGSNWNATGGTFNAGTGTVLFDAVSSGRQIKSSGRPFYNVVFNGSGGYWTLQDSMTVISSVTLAAGAFDTNPSANYGISVGKEWLNTGGNFVANLSTITFTGSLANLRIQAGGSAFGSLLMAGSGAWVTDSGPVSLNHDLTLSNGTLTVASGSAMTVTGQVTVQSGTTFSLQDDLTISGGSLSNAGTVTSMPSANLNLSGIGTLGGSGSTQLPVVTLSGNAQTTTMGGAVTIQGALTNGSGHTLDANNAGNYGITLSSSWLNSGSYVARNSSITFNGSSVGMQIDPGPSPFYKVAFTGSGQWSTANNPLTISSVVYLNSGNLTVAPGSTMTVTGNVFINSGATLTVQDNLGITGGTLSNSGTISATDPTSTLSLSGTGSLGGTGATTIPRLVLAGAAQTTTLAGPITVLGDLTNDTSHTLDANASGNYSLTISSSWANSGTYLSRTSSVTLNGSSSGLTANPGNSPFYKLAITGSGSWSTSTSPVTVSSTVVLSAGSLTVSPGSSMTVVGSLSVGSGATLDVENDLGLVGGSLLNNGTVTSISNIAVATASGTVTLGGAGSTTLPRVLLSGANQTTMLAGSITILGDLRNNSGHTLDVSNTGNYTLTVSSSWTNSGSFLARTGLVTFNGTSTGLTIVSGASPFYQLSVTGSGSWYSATNPITIANNVAVAAGTFGAGAGSSMTVTGTMDVQAAGTLDLQNNLLINGGALTNSGTVTSVTTSSLTLVGSGTLGGTGTTTLPHVILNGSGLTTTLGGNLAVQGQLTTSAGHTLDVNSTGSYQITISSNWTNSGTFQSQSGTVIFNSTATLNGNTTFYNLSSTTPGITLTLTAGTTQAITGTLTLAGGAGNLIALRSTSSGTQAYLRSLGSASINYVDVKDNKATGNLLSASASVDSGNNTNWVFATTRVWKGTSSTAWNLAGNWSPSGIPVSVDTVIFDNTSSRNCSINANAAVATFTMQGTNTRTISFSAGTISLLVTGDLTIGAGTFNQGSSAVTVGGSWIKSGGAYTAGTSSVTFNGSGLSNTISSGGSPFFRIGLNGTGQWSTNGTPLTVSSHVVLNNGTLVVASGSSMTVTGYVDVGALATLNLQEDIGINGGSLFSTGTITSVPSAIVTLSGTGILGGIGSTTLPITLLNGSGQTTTLGGPLSVQGALTNNANHTLDVSSTGNFQITISSDWTNAGTFTAQAGTVVVNSSSALTGSTTFYNFTSITPGLALTFAASSTQTVSGLLTLTGAGGNQLQMLSSSAGLYYLRVTGSSSVSQVAVQRSVASGSTIYAGKASLDNGQNVNWVFDYPPNAVSDLSATAQPNGDVSLTWSAPADPDDSPLGSGSQYAIEWATYTVTWSTSNTADTGYVFTNHVYISTSGVNAGDPQVYISTGLTGNISYSFRLWTQDPLGAWSSISNATATTVTPFLSVTFSTHAYAFGTVNLGATTVSTTAIVVNNLGNVTETYSLSVSTVGPLTVWGPGISLPTSMDTFVLSGAFNASPPSVGSFGAEDIMTSTATMSTATVFSIGGETGVSVPPAINRHLWMRLDMPPTTTTINTQQLTVAVSASSP